MVMDRGLSWPPDYWKNPIVPLVFTDIVKAAKVYDRKTGQPDCELDEKKEALKKIADGLGIKISFEEE